MVSALACGKNGQGQQPEMQAGRKRRRRSGIVKDRAVIEGDTPWQARGQKGASEHQLTGAPMKGAFRAILQ